MPEDTHSYRLPAAIDPMTLRRYFTLHGTDREEVGRCRGAGNALGFAVQLCTLRWRGHFLRDMAGVPSAIIETLAEQAGFLSLALAASLQGYPASEDTRLDHQERIRRHLGFSQCGAAERGRLLDHMVATAQTVPRAATLYPLACQWLLEQHIVRPGPSTIRDLLAHARDRALAITFETLAAELTQDACEQLDQLLLPPTPADGQVASTRSRLDAFRLPAPGASAAALVMLTTRLDELGNLGLARWPALHAVHPATRRLLAGWGYAYDAWSLRRFEPVKRRAILLCTLEAAFAEAADALVEMQDKLITRVHNRARKHRADLLHATDAAKTRAVSCWRISAASCWTNRACRILNCAPVSMQATRARRSPCWSRDAGVCARVTPDRTSASSGAGMPPRASIRPRCWKPHPCAFHRVRNWAWRSNTCAKPIETAAASWTPTRRWAFCRHGGGAMSWDRQPVPARSGQSPGRITNWRCCPPSTSASRAAT